MWWFEAKHDEGQVWLISDPFLFSNMLLQESDNSVLAASIACQVSRGGDFPRILFDEYHLGFTQSVTLADAARTPLGKAILYLCVVGSAGNCCRGCTVWTYPCP